MRQLWTAIFIAISLTLFIFSIDTAWQRLDLHLYDIEMRLTGKQHPELTSKVVVVGIQEQSVLNKKPFVFWYPELGQFFQKLSKFSPAAIGIDLIPVHSLQDKIPKTIPANSQQSSMFHIENATEVGRALDGALISGMMSAASNTTIIQGVTSGLVPFYYPFLPFMGKASPASLQMTLDVDGASRRAEFTIVNELKPFPFALAERWIDPATVNSDIYIDFTRLDSITQINFLDVLKPGFDGEIFKDKIVLLGLVSDVDDVYQTPLGLQHGVHIQATIVQTLLDGENYLKSLWHQNICIGFLLSSVVFFLVQKNSIRWSVATLTTAVICTTVGSLLSFYNGIILPLPSLSFLLFLTYCIAYMMKFVGERHEKRQIRQTFGYYVGDQVVDRITRGGDNNLMVGEEHQASIPFLDIRGFVQMTRDMSPQSIVSMLNIFFEQVTNEIQSRQGIVNKFIGDGMLAFFLTENSKIDDSLNAAIAICHATEKLNDSGALKEYIGDIRITVGIGIHAGPVVLGNIGSKRKLDFTVIGKSVNIASRIESMTKQFNTKVLVSDSIVREANNTFPFTNVGTTDIKGIDGEMTLYSLNVKA